MRKFTVILFATALTLILSCERRTFEDLSDNTPITQTIKYTDQVRPIIQNNCISCHSSGGAASYYPLTNYIETKSAIDNILIRIQKPSGDPEKMPQGGSLSQNSIDIIKKWKTDGLLE